MTETQNEENVSPENGQEQAAQVQPAEGLPSLKYKDKKEVLRGGLLGFFIGLAIIVPGVSGSAVAIIFRLYDKLLYALGNLLRRFRACVRFLLPVAAGAVIGLLLGFFAVQRLLDIAMFAVVGLFAGLMAGAYPAVTDEIKGERKSARACCSLPRAFSCPSPSASSPPSPPPKGSLCRGSRGITMCSSSCSATSSPSRRSCRGFPPPRC